MKLKRLIALFFALFTFAFGHSFGAEYHFQLSPSPQGACIYVSCWPGQRNSATGKCEFVRYRRYNITKTWSDAKKHCENDGGHLVTYSKAGEETTVESTLGLTGYRYWMGFNDIQKEGTWVWVTGEPVTYTNWAPGEPNNWANDEDCATGNRDSTPGWNDFPCWYLGVSLFVCEYEPPSGVQKDANAVCINGWTVEKRTYSDHIDLVCTRTAL